MRRLTKKQQKAFLDRLTVEAEELTGVLAALDEEDGQWARYAFVEPRRNESLDADLVTVERAVLNQLAQSTAAGTDAVLRALQKLQEGTYGVCDSCGKDIPLERLEARPRSVRCVACS